MTLKILDTVIINSSGYSFKKSLAYCIQVIQSEVSFGIAIAIHSVEIMKIEFVCILLIKFIVMHFASVTRSLLLTRSEYDVRKQT